METGSPASGWCGVMARADTSAAAACAAAVSKLVATNTAWADGSAARRITLANTAAREVAPSYRSAFSVSMSGSMGPA
jgi:hypothetical protein